MTVERNTPATPLIEFIPGNLDPEDLNTGIKQAIYLALEADGGSGGGGGGSDYDDSALQRRMTSVESASVQQNRDIGLIQSALGSQGSAIGTLQAEDTEIKQRLLAVEAGSGGEGASTATAVSYTRGSRTQSVQAKLEAVTNIEDFATFAEARPAGVARSVLRASTHAAATDMRILPPPGTSYHYAGPMAKTHMFAPQGVDLDALSFTSARLPFNNSRALGEIRKTTANSVHMVAEGSDINGPQRASVTQTISCWKEGFGTGAARTGEIDALYICLGQDSPRDGSTQDACGVLIDVRTYQRVGFVGGIEGITRIFNNADDTSVLRVGYQIGCIDTSREQMLAVGMHLSAYDGNAQYGLLISAETGAGGTFDRPISVNQNGRVIFELDNAGRVALRPAAGSAARTAIYTNAAGNFGILNDGFTSELFVLDQQGNGQFSRSLSTGLIQALTSMATPELVLAHLADGRITNTFRTHGNGNLGISKDGVENFSLAGNGNALFRGVITSAGINLGGGGVNGATATLTGSLAAASGSFSGLLEAGALHTVEMRIRGDTAANNVNVVTVDTSGRFVFSRAGTTLATLAGNGTLAVAGPVTSNGLTVNGNAVAGAFQSNQFNVQNVIVFTARPRGTSGTVVPGALYFEASTGHLVYHNGTERRILSNTALA